MLCGIVSPAGTSARDCTEYDRLRMLAKGADPTVKGRLGFATAGLAVDVAEAGAVTAVVDGLLYSDEKDLGAARLVLDAFRRGGVDEVAQLRGRFAGLIWDAQREEGALVCDVLATRPAFWRVGMAGTVFAAEIPDLLSVLTTRPAPDELSLVMWLGDGTCPRGRTIYDGVSRLGPGEFVRLGRAGSHREICWQPHYHGIEPGARAKLAESLREEVYRSTSRRMVSGRNAIILSGGIDSSFVALAADEARPEGAHVSFYSGIFPGESFDETDKIRDAVSRLSGSASGLEIEPQGAIRLGLEFMKRWQVPFVGAGALIDMSAVRAAAHDGASVVLDGQTGDELFGFSPYVTSDLLRRGRLPSVYQLMRQWPMGRRATRRNLRWIFRNVVLRGAAPAALDDFVRSRRDRIEAAPPWLRREWKSSYMARENPWAWKRVSEGPLWWRFLYDTLIWAPHEELRLDYLHHRAALEGVVSESPLYDPDLISFVLGLSPEFAFDWRTDRPLARAAMSGRLPDSVVLQRQKADFTAFGIRTMVSGDDGPISWLLDAADLRIGRYIDVVRARDIWTRVRKGSEDSGWLAGLWNIVSAEIWLRTLEDSSFTDEMLARTDVRSPRSRRIALSH
jgi:asparagine synthetase B (glutamine-hydrolysing)